MHQHKLLDQVIQQLQIHNLLLSSYFTKMFCDSNEWIWMQIMELREAVEEAEGTQALNQIKAQVWVWYPKLDASEEFLYYYFFNFFNFSKTCIFLPVAQVRNMMKLIC